MLLKADRFGYDESRIHAGGRVMADGFNEVLFDVIKEDMTSIGALSIETGISEDKLRGYLNGNDPDQYDAELISRALGVSMRTLFKHIRP